VIAVSSSIAVSLTLASLHYSWGLLGLWSSMTIVYFGIRVIAHYQRFNSEHGPFGKSTAELLYNPPPQPSATPPAQPPLPSDSQGGEGWEGTLPAPAS
jgi:hypothetical protein